MIIWLCCYPVAQSCLTLCDPMDCSMSGFPIHRISQSLLNSCSLRQWCHPTILSSVVPFSSCLQSCPASGSFLITQLFTSGGQSIGASASASSFQWMFRIHFLQDWLFDLLAYQGILKSLLQHLSSMASILWHSAFFMVQLSHLDRTTFFFSLFLW